MFARSRQVATSLPICREAKKVRREIRCLLFGQRRNAYRILYEVDDTKRVVWILHIRHGARRDLKARDIANPGELRSL